MNVEPSITRRRTHAALPDRVDVAIVGSGLGGLVAAAHLARAGMSVAVFEGHYTAGGCATQFARGPKRAQYHFDVGLHYIGDCAEDGQIPRLLSELDIDVKFRPMDQDGFDTLVFPGIEFRVPASVARYRDRMVDFFPHERRGIDRYCKLLNAVMTAGRAMERGRPGLREWPALALAGLRLSRHKDATMATVLDAIDVRDPGARAVMLGQSGDYGLPPSKVSAMLHLGLACHYFRGAYYPEGGGQVIADRLCARIESSGGSIHLRHPIERILVENGRAVGVRVAPRAGEPARDVRASLVLSNADLKKTFLELVGPEHLPNEMVERTERYEMAAALIITFLGLKGGVEKLGATNYWAFDTVDTESVYRDLNRRTGDIQTHGCYITSASRKDPGNALHHAPEGITNVEVMTLVPGSLERFGVDPSVVASWDYKKNERYRAIKMQLEEDMIRRLDALFPGAASHVVFRETATPVSHVRYTQATDGTGYGLAATPEQFLKNRPGYRSPIPGLYLCGASTRSGHGIVGAMTSGKHAALRIQKDRLASARVSRE